MRLLTSFLAAGLCAAVFATSASAEEPGPGRRGGPRSSRRAPPAAHAAQGHPKLAALLKRADRDNDGSLSRAEIAGLMRVAAQKKRAGAAHHPAAGPRRRPMAAPQRRTPGMENHGRRTHRAKAGRDRPSRAQAQSRRGASARQDGKRGKAQRMAMLFKRLDRDGNGQLSMREFAAGMARAHKGGVHQGAGHPMQAKQRGGRARPDARHANARHAKTRRAPQAADRGVRARGAAILFRLRQADANNDGRLTRREAPGLLKKHFGKLDRDEDGVLTMPEVKRAVQMLSKKHKKGAEKGEKQAKRKSKAGPDKDAKARAKARAKAKKRARKARAE